jgi:hypothetical protein
MARADPHMKARMPKDKDNAKALKAKKIQWKADILKA